MTSEQKKTVVIVDANLARAEQTALLVGFLEFYPHIVADENALRLLIAQNAPPIAVLVSDDADTRYSLLNASLQVISENGGKCVCYLIQDGRHRALPPAGFKPGLQGVIAFPLSCKDLTKSLKDADLIWRTRRRAGKTLAAPLFQRLDGTSRDIQYVSGLTMLVADTEASVLILGESGTGKEIVARNIHALSRRSTHAFVPINCGAIPSELLESELFGHEKGAFTGAVSARQGRFEMAEGGTLFLDEIGDMPLDMQVKLLRFLQERTFERVGSNKSIQANVRVVAATHQSLERLVAEGGFRMDLFYRLSVFPIDMPPLRNRTEDIPLLVKAFAKNMAQQNRDTVSLSDCALAGLAQYSWPGNVRELFNLMELLAILYPRQEVKWSQLPDKFRPNQDWVAEQLEKPVDKFGSTIPQKHHEILNEKGIDLKIHLADIECDLMTQALEQCDWVVARAAKRLNLQRTTLVEKMRKFSICKPEEMSVF